WPDGVVEEFATDESYFYEIHEQLEQDLREIGGARLLWQTKDNDSGSAWDDDSEHDPPPPSADWLSYHLFFLAPEDAEFQFEDEIEGLEEPDDPHAEDWMEKTFPGEGWFGCAVGISLVARFAAINLSQYSHYEDGSASTPDIESFIYSDATGERVDTDEYHREALGQKAFQKLEKLRGEIAAVLAKRRIRAL